MDAHLKLLKLCLLLTLNITEPRKKLNHFFPFERWVLVSFNAMFVSSLMYKLFSVCDTGLLLLYIGDRVSSVCQKWHEDRPLPLRSNVHDMQPDQCAVVWQPTARLPNQASCHSLIFSSVFGDWYGRRSVVNANWVRHRSLMSRK